MAESFLGRKPEPITGSRDACHVACVVAVSDRYLEPGTKVVFVEKPRLTKVVEHSGGDLDDYDGIVDPFLTSGKDHDEFWILLRPGLATKLTHNFQVDREKLSVDEGYDDGCRMC